MYQLNKTSVDSFDIEAMIKRVKENPKGKRPKAERQNDTMEKLKKFLNAHPRTSAKEILKVITANDKTIRTYLSILRRKGFIEGRSNDVKVLKEIPEDYKIKQL